MDRWLTANNITVAIGVGIFIGMLVCIWVFWPGVS